MKKLTLESITEIMEMESESEIEYAERWTGGILELKAYKSFNISDQLALMEPNRVYHKRGLVIPLPSDFKLGPNIDKCTNCLIIVGDRLIREGVKKKWRVERVFKEPGRISTGVIFGNKFEANSVVWISKEKLMKITQRSLFMDQNFIELLYKKS